METPTCQIKWIDKKTSKPTPDNNPSVGRVRCKHYYPHTHPDPNKAGQFMEYSDYYHICAQHADRMMTESLHNWEWEPRILEDMENALGRQRKRNS
jgi:hypothetical protein